MTHLPSESAMAKTVESETVTAHSRVSLDGVSEAGASGRKEPLGGTEQRLTTGTRTEPTDIRTPSSRVFASWSGAGLLRRRTALSPPALFPRSFVLHHSDGGLMPAIRQAWASLFHIGSNPRRESCVFIVRRRGALERAIFQDGQSDLTRSLRCKRTALLFSGPYSRRVSSFRSESCRGALERANLAIGHRPRELLSERIGDCKTITVRAVATGRFRNEPENLVIESSRRMTNAICSDRRGRTCACEPVPLRLFSDSRSA